MADKLGGKVLVVLSGGQDSTTALFWARQRYGEVHALTIDYGQRHRIELDAAKAVAGLAQVASHEVVTVGKVLGGTSPLVSDDNPVGHYKSADELPGGVEPTFVPARNFFFIALAANRAAVLGISTLVLGVCQEDFGGYPDCRRRFIDHCEAALSEGLFGEPGRYSILTPLMFLTKADSVRMAKGLGGECWEALGHTHTCYDGAYPPNPFNHASILRARGFHAADETDPLIVRAIGEGVLPIDYPGDGLVAGTPYGDPGTWAEMVKPGGGAEAVSISPKRKKRDKGETTEV